MVLNWRFNLDINCIIPTLELVYIERKLIVQKEIFCLSNELPIDKNLRIGIQIRDVKDEITLIKEGFVQKELRPKMPSVVFYPLVFGFVFAVKRIGQRATVPQKFLHCTCLAKRQPSFLKRVIHFPIKCDLCEGKMSAHAKKKNKD